ncbi:ABC transporter substrate-binding protein [Nocardioides sp. GXZ039]|uniref:ABC transporter substrate-binding protein n=1 Tax=Nocardioides sp. GXZ039 TaxID=3136018 RepID=UPI0030F49B11
MRRTRGAWKVAALLSASLVLAACNGDSGGSEDAIEVGVVIPLSGPTAGVGEYIQRGYELAQEEINADGGIDGRDLEFKFGDHAGDPATGAREARTLVQQDKVVALTGSYESGVTLVVAQTAEQLKAPYIVPYSSATSITESGFTYTFRTRPPLPEWAKTMTDFLTWQADNGGQPVEKVGLLVDGTEYGDTAAAAYEEAAQAAGLTVVDKRTLTQGDTNLSAQMTQLRNSGAQAILASTYLESSMGAIRTLDSLDWDVPYMTVGSGIVAPAFFDLGELANGVTSTTSWASTIDNEASKKFAEAYKAKYDAEPTDDAAYAYAAAYLIKEAIEKAGEDADAEAIAETLRTAEFTSEGANIIPTGGTLKFDEKGQAHPAILMAQAEDGVWNSVFPEEFASSDYVPSGG